MCPHSEAQFYFINKRTQQFWILFVINKKKKKKKLQYFISFPKYSLSHKN